MPNKQKNRPILRPLMIAIVATTMVLIFIVLALLLRPQAAIPEFDIQYREWGAWEAHGKIAVFDEKINPDSKGEFQFIIKNESEEELRFGFVFTEYVNTTAEAHSFMYYQLKMNNVNIDNDDTVWHTAEELNYSNLIILPGTQQLMTLAWHWPFESGHDENDTLLGVFGGELSIHFLILAEVVA